MGLGSNFQHLHNKNRAWLCVPAPQASWGRDEKTLRAHWPPSLPEPASLRLFETPTSKHCGREGGVGEDTWHQALVSICLCVGAQTLRIMYAHTYHKKRKKKKKTHSKCYNVQWLTETLKSKYLVKKKKVCQFFITCLLIAFNPSRSAPALQTLK